MNEVEVKVAKKLEGYYSEEKNNEASVQQEEGQKPDDFQFLSLLKNQIRVDKKLEI